MTYIHLENLLYPAVHKAVMQAITQAEVGWPAKFRKTKFREMFREIFISHFAKFSNE